MMHKQYATRYTLYAVVRSTLVESALQISPFYSKQTQSQVGENQRKHFFNSELRKNGQLVIQKNKANTNPIQTQFVERPKLMQSEYIQRIKKKYAAMGYEKTKPKQNQSAPGMVAQKPMRKPLNLRII